MRLARWGQQRIEDHRLAVELQVTALGFQLREREPPVHAAARRAVPRHARAVDEFTEEAGRLDRSQHLDGRVLGHERAARLDHRAEPSGRRLDFGREVGRRALPPALAQPGEPEKRSPRTLGDRTKTGPMRPDDVGVEPFDPSLQERTALPARKGCDVRAVRPGFVLDWSRAAEQVEVEPGARRQPRQQPLPEAQHAVHLAGRPAVHGGGPEPARTGQLARTGQAGMAVVQPAPVGQLLGQRARRLMGAEFLGHPHGPRPRIFRCHGSAAHLPGSNRAGWRDAARSTASIAGSLRPASQPAP